MLHASMLEDYSMIVSMMLSCFLRHTDLLGNPFPIMSVTDLLFLLFSFLDHHTGHLACHDARILLYECILDALLKFFSPSFRSIGSLLPIGRHSTSLRSGKTSNRSAAKLALFSFLDRHACYSTCR
jgi:hypothetical protein